MSPVRSPNPKRALDSVLRCATRADAEARMTEILARAWSAGSSAGWRDGVADANGTRKKDTPNPYRVP